MYQELTCIRCGETSDEPDDEGIGGLCLQCTFAAVKATASPRERAWREAQMADLKRELEESGRRAG